MRILVWLAVAVLSSTCLRAQGFECDGSFYLVVYTQSEGESVLYQITGNGSGFNYEPIALSEKRRLTSLAYNVLDKYLYALDVDSYELIRIHRDGMMEDLGRPENLDTSFVYNSATTSPDGTSIFLMGYNPDFGSDRRIYTMNLSRSNFYAGYLGVTGPDPVIISDLATDPIQGIMYGFDIISGKLAEVAIGGQVTTHNSASSGNRSIDALFFDRSGELYAYSAQSGMYYLNKRTGVLSFLEKGPEGTHADGCACPYTYDFTKEVKPIEIVPCSEFNVTYRFKNQLGIGQTWIDIRDTFPEGFEILSLESSIVSGINMIASEPNILALENLIYLLGDNAISLTVKSPPDFTGSFGSNAVHWEFPLAFGEFQYSDDPATTQKNDPTYASVLPIEEIAFDAEIEYSCEGDVAFLESPFIAESYSWNTGEETAMISVTEPGTYTLRASNECVVFVDSIKIMSFGEPAAVEITGIDQVVIGGGVSLKVESNMDGILQYTWNLGDTIFSCECPIIEVIPAESGVLTVSVMDERGCIAEDDHQITVLPIRYTYAPTAFSPNNDGINDFFYIESSVSGIIRRFTVYNRWGSPVFDDENIPLNDMSSGWDGRFKGDRLSPGVYIWVAEIEYLDGLSETLHGDIFLSGN